MSFEMILQCARGQGAVGGFPCERCGERSGAPPTDVRMRDKTCAICAIKLEAGLPCPKVIDVKRDVIMFHVEHPLKDWPTVMDSLTYRSMLKHEDERLREADAWLRLHMPHGQQWAETRPREARTDYFCDCGASLWSPWVSVKGVA